MLYSIFQIVYLLVLFSTVCIALYFLKKGMSLEFLWLYLSVSFGLDFLMFVLQFFFITTVKLGYLYNLYIVFSAYFFLNYFNKSLSRPLKRINYLFFSSFLLLFVFFVFENFYEVNQKNGIAFSMLYIVYSLIWFYSKIQSPDQVSIMEDSKFWVASGLLLWAVFFILRIIPRYLFSKVDHELLVLSQSFFFVINILFYSLLFVAILKYNRK